MRELSIIIPADLNASNEAHRLLAQQAYPASQYQHRTYQGEPLKPADTTYSDMANRGGEPSAPVYTVEDYDAFNY